MEETKLKKKTMDGFFFLLEKQKGNEKCDGKMEIECEQTRDRGLNGERRKKRQ